MIHVLVAGFRGAMGQKTVKMVQSQKDFALSAVFDPKATAADAQKYGLPADTKVLTSYDQLNPDIADVWIDFTNPTAVAANIEAAIKAGIHPVVGTSGM
ncbi:4-hydroxy-tetrahydrodipicolinate reductase, partial [Lacticaseibacillus rhamnosus]|nr:4-hydroxy-tetrahydrodipicolinate reductase [Lacticaseibacillus rhamnosus]